MWLGADGVALRLQADGVDTLLVVPSNGEFEFAHSLGTGSSYTVVVASNPARHTCVVDGDGNGIVAGADVTEVSIRCTGPDVIVEFPGNARWIFDPSEDAQAFTGPMFEGVTLHVDGPSLLEATLDGKPIALGEDVAPFGFGQGATRVQLGLKASGDLSTSFRLNFERGPGSVDELAYGKPATTATGAHVGQAIAVDTTTLVAGAPTEGAGAVYVFERSGDAWIQRARLTSAAASSREFGRSVAVYAGTVVVGAPGDSSSSTGIDGDPSNTDAPESGAVYVFTRSEAGWTQQAYIKASNGGANDRFGTSVALFRDTLAVGAPGEPNRGTMPNRTSAGAAYVFQRFGSWRQAAFLKASNADALDEFGTSVAVLSSTVVVGSPGEASASTTGDQFDNSSPSAGAIYVFEEVPGIPIPGGPPGPATWEQKAYVKASNPSAGALFGTSVALSLDAIAVGAIGEASTATGVNGTPQAGTATSSGAVYLFGREARGWSQEAYVKASNTGANDQFGASVALSGDLLGVGAAGEASSGHSQADNSAPSAGAAYLFVRNTAGWVQSTYVKASNADAGDQFGASVAMSSELVVGAPGEASGATGFNAARADNTAPGAGAFYVFR